MWIVKIALRAPYTFTGTGGLTAHRRRTQHAPDGKRYLSGDQHPGGGDYLDLQWTARTQEMAQRITTVSERASTTNVNNIEHTVSETYPILEIKPQWVREREGMGSKKSFGMGFGVIDGLQGVRQICGSFKGEFSQWKHLLPVGE